MEEVNIKEASKGNWTAPLNDNGSLGNEVMKIACLMRIADATELMAKNYLSMQSSLDYYSKKSDRLEGEIDRLKRSNSALKGHIGRLKRNK